MSKPQDILSQIQATLKNDATLNTYVKDVLLERRESITRDHLPIILLEHKSNEERKAQYPKLDNFFSLNIVAIAYAFDVNLHPIGDANYKGDLEFENDIKKALSQDITLNGKALEFEFPLTNYGLKDYPAHGFEINMIVHYRQDFITRT